MPDRQSDQSHKSTELETYGISAAGEVYLNSELELWQ